MCVKFFISTLILLFAIHTNAQDLELTVGSRTKVFKAGTFITVELPTPNQEPCEECPLTSMTGQLVSSVDGKINLKVRRSSEPLVELKENVGSLTKYYDHGDQPVLSIPKEVIMSITKADSKSESATTAGVLVGTLLVWAGTGHLISSPIAGFKEDEKGGTLLWLGLSEVAIGAVLISAFQSKPFITSVNCPKKGRGRGSHIWTIR